MLDLLAYSCFVGYSGRVHEGYVLAAGQTYSAVKRYCQAISLEILINPKSLIGFPDVSKDFERIISKIVNYGYNLDIPIALIK